MDTNMALTIPGAGDGGENAGEGNLNVSEAVKGISPSDKEALIHAIRGALERRDAERTSVDANAIRRARLSEKAATFKARNGMDLEKLTHCEKK